MKIALNFIPMKRLFTLTLVLLFFSGCGIAPSPQPPKNTNQDNLAEQLRLKVTTEEVEGGHSEYHPPHTLSVDGNVITIREKLFLNDPRSLNPLRRKEYSLSWSEDTLSSPIRTAQFTHQVLDTQNRLKGNLRPKVAWHDLEKKQWKIPLSEIFRDLSYYPLENINEEDTQILKLELILANPQQEISSQVQIKFQVCAPLPLLPITQDITVLRQQTLARDAETMVRNISRGQFVIHREQITNTTKSSFILWLRSMHPQDPLSFLISISHPEFIERATEPPLGPHHQIAFSKSTFTVSEVQVTHIHSSQSESIPLIHLWNPLPIRPLETLRLEWKAKPVENQNTCNLPPDITQHLRWTVPERVILNPDQRVFRELLIKIPAEHHTMPVQINWKITGSRLFGNWNRSIRIGNTFNLFFENQNLLPLLEETVTLDNTQNEFQPSSTPFNCQGIFF